MFPLQPRYLRALELLPQVSLAHTLVRLLIYMIVLFVLYVIVVLVFRYALHASDSILRKIGMAAFNTLVLAIPVINRSAAYTVGEVSWRGPWGEARPSLWPCF